MKADNYQAAWQAVCKRFDDKRKIVNAHMSSLFSVKKMINGSSSELRRLIDAFTSNLSALKEMSYAISDNDDLANLFVVYMATYRLDEDTLKDWRKYTDDDTPKWSQMITFLEIQRRNLDDVAGSSKKLSIKVQDVKVEKIGKTFSSSSVVGKEQHKSAVSCPLCSESHRLWSCKKILDMNVDQRSRVVRENDCCYNCLSKGHSVMKCTSKHRCSKCNKKHHSSIHLEKYKSSSEVNSDHLLQGQKSSLSPDIEPFKPFNMSRKNSGGTSNVSALNGEISCFVTNRRTILTTAVVEVEASDGSVHLCRALLDTGSDCNFVTSSMVKKLKLNCDDICIPMMGINGKVTIVKQQTIVKISYRYGKYELDLDCAVMPDITGDLPTVAVDIQEFDIPVECFLADPKFNETSHIDMLLNIDVDNNCKLGDRIKMQQGPWMNHTKFGWTVGGFISNPTCQKSSSLLSCFTMKARKGETNIEEKLDTFFKSEEVQSASHMLSPEEKYCVDLYEKTTTRDETGRYIVRMPLKENSKQLGTNLKSSMRQLYSQEAKRLKDEVVTNFTLTTCKTTLKLATCLK